MTGSVEAERGAVLDSGDVALVVLKVELLGAINESTGLLIWAPSFSKFI